MKTGIEFTYIDGTKESYDPIDFQQEFEETETSYLLHMTYKYEIQKKLVSVVKEKRNYAYFKHNNSTNKPNGFYIHYVLYNELVQLLEPIENNNLTKVANESRKSN
jgi:hypothetical protein